MPIGTSKVGALGGLVPGGSVTFNTSGNWTVPPGVKKVSITGRGGTGNPGTAGNPGNPGTLGQGGTGGRGFGSPSPLLRWGGAMWTGRNGNFSSSVINSAPANTSRTGDAGAAGTVGNSGNAGNPGQPSSGLGNTFPGGAGGNAPPGGAAGNGGAGGNGGSQANSTSGAGGGNGGGSGSSAAQYNIGPPPCQDFLFGGGGGGGAGASNDGSPGGNQLISINFSCDNPAFSGGQGGRAGNTSNYSVPISVPPNPTAQQLVRLTNPQYSNIPAIPTNTTGGLGATGQALSLTGVPSFRNFQFCPGGGTIAFKSSPCIGNVLLSYRVCNPGNGPAFTPYPINCPAAQALRSGSGGGAGTTGVSPISANNAPVPFRPIGAGGGGGGGGRGSVGNAGGASPTVSGSGGTPQTFNCVTVTPGATTPIVIGSPGGQIVISWNPQ